MGTLQKVIRKKYLACVDNFKSTDLLTDAEYNVVSNCNLDELYNVESTPSVLEQICEGEKIHTAEYYDQQEKKYHRQVAKVYRNVKAKPTLPRIVEHVAVPDLVNVAVLDPVNEGVPAPVNMAAPESAPSTTPSEPIDVVRDLAAVDEPRSQTHDPYQMVEELVQPPVLSVVLPAQDDNFGSLDADGCRDFLELCTGTDLPPMTLKESSTQDLVLSQLGIPVRPLNDNFQEIDLQGFEPPSFPNHLKHSTPLNETNAHQPTVVAILPADGRLINEQPMQSQSVDMPMMRREATNAPGEAVRPVEASDEVPTVAREATDHREVVVQVEPDRPREALEQEGSASSLSTNPRASPVRRARRANDFTRRLPLLVDSLPRPRRSFDIFSYQNQTNQYPMIEYVQGQLLHHQPAQGQPLVETSLVMRAASGINATNATSDQSNNQGSRYPFTTPAAESLENRSNTPAHIELSQIPDSQGANLTSTNTSNAPMLPPLTSLEGQLLEMSENYQLPSLVAVGKDTTHAKGIKGTNTAGHGEEAAPSGAGMRTITQRDAPLSIENLNNKLTEAAITNEGSATAVQIDTMLVDIIILVQGEMCRHNPSDAPHYVTIRRLKELLRIETRIDVAKIIKNVILLKQAGLLNVIGEEDNSIAGVSINLPSIDLDAATSP